MTPEHPTIYISEDDPILGDVYYSTNPNGSPIETGVLYTGPFVPEQSGDFYFQVKFLFFKSEPQLYYVTTIEKSLKRLGEQEEGSGETSNNVEHSEKNVDLMEYAVSQEQSFDYYNLPDRLRSGWGDNIGGKDKLYIGRN